MHNEERIKELEARLSCLENTLLTTLERVLRMTEAAQTLDEALGLLETAEQNEIARVERLKVQIVNLNATISDLQSKIAPITPEQLARLNAVSAALNAEIPDATGTDSVSTGTDSASTGSLPVDSGTTSASTGSTPVAG